MTKQKRATVVSTSVAAFLTLIKLIIGLLSGSVAVLASAVDSILDMFVSIFNYFAISKSEQPADKEFNYGKGKVESLASVIEGTIIALSGFFLLYQALKKWLNEEVSTHIDTSIMVMLISLLITFFLVLYLNKIAKETNSLVIKADSLHYKTDLLSNLAVLVSLALVYFTQNDIFDVIVGACIAIYIIYSAYELLKEGVLVLLDRALEPQLVEQIKANIIQEELVSGYHLLKTREAGHQTFVDVHVVFNCLITLLEAHKVVDRIEENLKKLDEKRDWIITIHMDPYDDLEINEEK
jgi:cation diffusion facilitator family transporter